VSRQRDVGLGRFPIGLKFVFAFLFPSGEHVFRLRYLAFGKRSVCFRFRAFRIRLFVKVLHSFGQYIVGLLEM
jgi:hypothetical protein